ncbi:TolB family protein [Fulvivirga lutea]|uniref:Exo-alpha-sialidase n=1 Tax=Fulvivirga lutea TaxID=2810512 RepID=A0A974WMS5_9BACT|nr:glycoside hydrolase [Fulvivirga lutea]QSE99155.1 exo-alpha-sialidase [Fulvivirga lutea]
MRFVVILLFLFVRNISSSFCQEICLPFEIGNGLTFATLDTVYISKSTGLVDERQKPIYRIYMHVLNEDKWSEAIEVSFSNGKYTDYHPEIFQDSLMIFISRRPEPGTNDPVPYGNLWMVMKSNNAWGEPQFISELNHKGHDTYPTLTKSGRLYFNSDRPGGKGSMDIYVSNYMNGKFSDPTPLNALNTTDSENDLVIDPDEKFIIFNRYSFETGELDLFISFNEEGNWSEAQPLTQINEKGVFELTPTLSTDKKYFYYEVEGRVHCLLLETILKKS